MQFLRLVFHIFTFSWLSPAVVWAQVREDSEVFLAPALEVFSGTGTNDEVFYIGIILISLGLAIAVIAINITFFIKALTVKLLLRIFSMWLIFSAGVSVFSISVYLQQPPPHTLIQADVQATPRQIRVRYTPEQIILTWRTDKSTIGQIFYWTDQDPTTDLLISNQGISSFNHQITIPRSTHATLYVSILSDGIEYRLNGQPLTLSL